LTEVTNKHLSALEARSSALAILYQAEEERAKVAKSEVTTITIRSRPSDYMAYANGDTRLWDCGDTPQQAVEKLRKTHPNEVRDTPYELAEWEEGSIEDLVKLSALGRVARTRQVQQDLFLVADALKKHS
jgi:hypothetical protein